MEGDFWKEKLEIEIKVCQLTRVRTDRLYEHHARLASNVQDSERCF